ncbi:hypothetical protein [Streptomyces sp. NPDC059071]|uniref:hypothetical protein n=1 Tax=unclassified Streptomyces TaxID=2593676 RepID=UPI0036591B3E
MTEPELWTIAQVAEHLGVKAPSARGQLSRWGITATSAVRTESGRWASLYDATQVRTAAASRPGQGARTDRT